MLLNVVCAERKARAMTDIVLAYRGMLKLLDLCCGHKNELLLLLFLLLIIYLKIRVELFN